MADGKFTGFAPGMARSPRVTAILRSYDGHRPPAVRTHVPPIGGKHPLPGSRGTR